MLKKTQLYREKKMKKNISKLDNNSFFFQDNLNL